ncbi:hypothetical protein QBC38DRAFT_459483 [Podospora fimiseda]|uniref:F-box domain-containing protein n=1 Tax=Podospora fimiseda TaxID=252190 RepID=A0AAN7GNN7_9PEZI|nr:hypothetical protein QBC38DRAFT_459483 [Podospora fimiseda]
MAAANNDPPDLSDVESFTAIDGPGSTGTHHQQTTIANNDNDNNITSSPTVGCQGGGSNIINGLIGLSSSIQESIVRIVRDKASDNGKESQGEIDLADLKKLEVIHTDSSSEHTTITTRHHNHDDDKKQPEEFTTIIPDHGPRPRPQNIMQLPPELLLAIISHCPFADIIRLRQTCKFFRHMASPNNLRIMLGKEELRKLLHNHCKKCLIYDQFGRKLLLSPVGVGDRLLTNECHACVLREKKDERIQVGRKVCLADNSTAWVCRWCGWPITGSRTGVGTGAGRGANGVPAYGHEQWHRACYGEYTSALVLFAFAGFFQFCFGVVGAALSWKYFRDWVAVFAPSVTGFLLLWLCLGFITFRGNRRETYHWTFLLELVILGLWIMPVCFIGKHFADHPDQKVSKSVQASLALFGLNILFRFINLIGNTILLFKPDVTRRCRPEVSKIKKAWYKVICFFIFWTYPASLEQKNPPDQRG